MKELNKQLFLYLLVYCYLFLNYHIKKEKYFIIKITSHVRSHHEAYNAIFREH